jgi:hypothetical protein
MFHIAMAGLLVAAGVIIFLARAHADGTPRIKGDFAAQLVAIACTAVASVAFVSFLELLLT